jgi:hypothetical protein
MARDVAVPRVAGRRSGRTDRDSAQPALSGGVGPPSRSAPTAGFPPIAPPAFSVLHPAATCLPHPSCLPMPTTFLILLMGRNPSSIFGAPAPVNPFPVRCHQSKRTGPFNPGEIMPRICRHPSAAEVSQETSTSSNQPSAWTEMNSGQPSPFVSSTRSAGSASTTASSPAAAPTLGVSPVPLDPQAACARR